jgi:uncharacterized protein YjgD (DUF1641 family)
VELTAMATTTTEPTLAELNRKIDDLAAQVGRIVEEAEAQRRRRLDRAELTQDLVPIATEAYGLAVRQLDEVEEYVQLEDILRVGKRVLRNTRNIEKMLEQLEAMRELAEELTPLSQDMVLRSMATLEDFERRGYFDFVKGGLNIVDHIVTSFDESDLAALGDNVVLILQTVREMTQPEVMKLLQHTASVVRDAEVPENVSLFRLMRDMRDPAVKRGLSRMLGVLRSFDPGALSETTDNNE